MVRVSQVLAIFAHLDDECLAAAGCSRGRPRQAANSPEGVHGDETKEPEQESATV